jgi:hypothetical protein
MLVDDIRVRMNESPPTRSRAQEQWTDRPRLGQLCRHDANHVVVGTHLGLDIEHVSLSVDDEDISGGFTRCSGKNRDGEFGDLVYVLAGECDGVERPPMFLRDGSINHDGLTDDRAKACVIAALTARGDGAAARELIAGARREAQQLVKRFAEPITVLARILERDGSLSAALIKAVAIKHGVVKAPAPRAASTPRGIAMPVAIEDGKSVMEGERGGKPYLRRMVGHLVASPRR